MEAAFSPWLEQRTGELARLVVRVKEPGFETDFNNQPDYLALRDLYRGGYVSFSRNRVREAIHQMLAECDRTLDNILDELDRRISINIERQKNLCRFRLDRFVFEPASGHADYRIEGTEVPLKQLRDRLVYQFGDGAYVREAGVRSVIFSQNFCIKDPGKQSREWAPQEAKVRPDWERIAVFGGRRILGLYEGLSGWYDDPAKIYNMDGRQMQEHLQERKHWRVRELIGTVIHELAHGLETRWNEQMYRHWLGIVHQDQGKKKMTRYLQQFDEGIWTAGKSDKLNCEEEFCESVKIFCTSVEFLKERWEARDAFIRQYYPLMRDSKEVWDGRRATVLLAC